MAKQPEDTNTNDMFEPLEKMALQSAVETHQATLRRKINTEKNEQIKQIYSKELERYNAIWNKITGWMV